MEVVIKDLRIFVCVVLLFGYSFESTALGGYAPGSEQQPKKSQVSAVAVGTRPVLHHSSSRYSLSSELLQPLQLRPRTILSLTSGDYTIGGGQILFPLLGNQNHALYSVVNGNIVIVNNGDIGSGSSSDKHDSYDRNKRTWLVGGGAGYRRVVNPDSDRGRYIYGGYFTLHCNRSPSANSFWVANAGLELLGNDWDLRINGYLPIQDSISSSSRDWAQNHGIDRYGVPKGHDYYDNLGVVQRVEKAARGVDLKIGKSVPYFAKAQVHLGGYHFEIPNTRSINGLSAKLSYNVNQHVTFELAHTYDTFMRNCSTVGVKIKFGEYSEEDKQRFGIAHRLLDALDLGYGGYAGTIVPMTAMKKFIPGEQKKRFSNVQYVRSNNQMLGGNRSGKSVLQDGTAEHPYYGLTAENYAAIKRFDLQNPNLPNKPILFLAMGEYNLHRSGFVDSRLTLEPGFSIYGRRQDYGPISLNGERPTIIGIIHIAPKSFSASGFGATAVAANSSFAGNNTIDSLRILFPSDHPPASTDDANGIIQLDRAKNVSLRNVIIGAQYTHKGFGGYRTGIWLDNGSELNLSDVTIHADCRWTGSCAGVTAVGINANNQSTINFQGGTNNIIVESLLVPKLHTLSLPSVLSALSVPSAPFAPTKTMVDAVGISASDNSTINFYNGVTNITATATTLRAVTDNSTEGNTTTHATRANVTTTGIFLERGSTLNFYNGRNSITAYGGGIPMGMMTGYGICADSAAIINFHGGVNSVTAANTRLAGGDIYTHAVDLRRDSIVNFWGGVNNLYASSIMSDGQSSSINAQGLYVHRSMANFFGGVNSITSSAATKQNGYSELIDSYGIFAYRSTVNFWGGENVITALSGGDGDNLAAYGIRAYTDVVLNFFGGINNVNAISSLTAKSRKAATFGVDLLGSTVNFRGGINKINAQIDNSHEKANAVVYGIHATASDLSPSIVNFVNGVNSINVGIKGAGMKGTAHGIYVDQESLLQIKGSKVGASDLSSVLEYVTLTRAPGSYTKGYKIWWPNMARPDYIAW